MGHFFADCKSNIVAILIWFKLVHFHTVFIPKLLPRYCQKHCPKDMNKCKPQLLQKAFRSQRGSYQLFIKENRDSQNDILLLLYVQCAY